MKIELTIKTDYLPSWGVWQGIRELVQNGRDAETMLGAALTVDHSGESLRITNDGCVLPHEALLLGYTTKANRDDAIGQWGEGLKLGILALVRAGIVVKIRSGSEVWTPTIQRSEKFKADVLTFDIQGGRKPENRVRVEIQGITKEMWADARWKFRFIGDNTDPENEIHTSAGTLLRGEKMKGHVFVKGMYVHTDAKLAYGYDIANAALDRDRRMVDTYDFRWRARDILNEAVTKMPSELPAFINALEQQTPDMLGFDALYGSASPALAEVVAEDFVSKHGEKAVPVRTLGESKELDHLGRKGVVVSDALGAVLRGVLPSATEVEQALKKEAVKTYGWTELSPEEQAHLTEAVELVNTGAERVSLDHVNVVDFRSPTLKGLFEKETTGRETISLSKAILSDRDMTLLVLVHETAHKAGSDGDKDHITAVEHIWAAITKKLRNQLAN